MKASTSDSIANFVITFVIFAILVFIVGFIGTCMYRVDNQKDTCATLCEASKVEYCVGTITRVDTFVVICAASLNENDAGIKMVTKKVEK